MTTLYGIPNCDTVKKARAWLNEHGVAHDFHDFKKHGVPNAAFDNWLSQVGWDVLVNRKGTTWRQLDEAARTAVVDATSARSVLLSHPTLIKRPVVQWTGQNDAVTVGFDPADWHTRAG